MIPGMNPRKMQKMMKRMGIQQQEIDATEVIIKCEDKDIIITSPQVSKVNMMGKQTYQIVGEEHIKEKQAQISPEDIKTVAEQTNKSKEQAENALIEAKGDLAAAILKLQE